MKDPLEGVLRDGTIVTGVDSAATAETYQPLLDDAVASLTEALGNTLHGIYVYGSVATGQARPPTSDVDLLVVLGTDVEPVAVGEVARELTARYGMLVRAVGIAVMTPSDLHGERPASRGNRCFVKHYCRHLAGMDVRAAYRTCHASVDLAVGFNGDVGEVLAEIERGLETVHDEPERQALTIRACRKLLFAAATLLSAERGGWSTSREVAVDLVAQRQPALAHLARLALLVGDGEAADDRVAVDAIIEDLGGWIVQEYGRAAGSTLEAGG